ncbi:DUF1129 family protein [Halobacillus sp. Marseille-Q1614]|uniref:DUF1129 family protein n=1 Tax=Halobacillus sp. Marseille-Q1614 TaxID=2709134 RepID=UPI00156E5148|nr:DUF1129 family protein [Halobacillus sp. Marseille-Q1614]
MTLSKQSEEFLENLQLYLTSAGRSEHQIEEIVGELEDHLTEAESEGKNVDSLIGQSPKEYMEQIAAEMPLNRRTVFQYISMIILGAFAYILLGDVINGGITLSVLELAGYPMVVILFTLLTAAVFRYMASSSPRKTKEWILFGILGFTPIVLFGALIFANQYYSTSSIEFNTAANVIAAVAAVAVFVGMAIWSKTWFTIIIPLLLFVPELLVKLTSFTKETQLAVSSSAMFIGMMTYLFFIGRKAKAEEKRTSSL